MTNDPFPAPCLFLFQLFPASTAFHILWILLPSLHFLSLVSCIVYLQIISLSFFSAYYTWTFACGYSLYLSILKPNLPSLFCISPPNCTLLPWYTRTSLNSHLDLEAIRIFVRMIHRWLLCYHIGGHTIYGCFSFLNDKIFSGLLCYNTNYPLTNPITSHPSGFVISRLLTVHIA